MPNRLPEISGEITPERMKKVVQETKCNHSILCDIVCYLNVYIVIIKTVTMLPTLSSLAPTRVLLPGVLPANRTRLSSAQEQRKALLFDQGMKRWSSHSGAYALEGTDVLLSAPYHSARGNVSAHAPR